MKKQRTADGGKNIVSERVKTLRTERGMSQRKLAEELDKRGYKMDRNIIYRIERNERYVTDVEIKAFTEVFDVDYKFFMEGK